jgi:hypothetical protein
MEGWKNLATSDLGSISGLVYSRDNAGVPIPVQLQLAKPNVALRVVVASGSEFDILGLI